MAVSLRWQETRAKACVVVAILLMSAALRFHQVTTRTIWLDEAFSVLLSRLSPEQILFHTARDVHPPLYYLILHYWMQWFGSDALAVRSLSVGAGVASVGMGMLLTRHLASWRAAMIAGLLLAFFPMAIRFSQEARMYALLSLLLLSAIYMLWQWVSKQKNLYLVAYSLLMVAALYTHYFAALCALANWLYLSVTTDSHGKRLVLARAWWVGHVGIVVAYLPWLPILYRQLHHRELVAWIVHYPASLLSMPRSFWNAFTQCEEAAYADVLSVLLSIFLVFASLRVLRHVSTRGQPNVLLLSYCFVPILVVWLISYAMPLFINRYLLFSLMGLPLLVAVAADTWPRRTLLASVAGCLFIELAGLAYAYNYQAKPGGDLGTVMAHVNKYWRSGDALLVDRKRHYLSIEYYNATGRPAFLYTQIEPDATGKAATTYGTLTLFYQRSDELYVTTPQRLANHFKRLWLVTEPSSAYTPRMPVDGWVKVDEIVEGSFKALLFAVPEQANR